MARAVAARRPDVVLMAAAVADYAPPPVAGKRAKSAEPWQVTLEPTEDILRGLGERKNGQVLVAFGAEEGDEGLERKRRMLDEKNVDLVVYNDISRDDIGFDAPENEVVLVTRSGERRIGKSPKEHIAAAILDEVERLVEGLPA
jgi:phosphopantothenoylcysteine decarboxylase/phosphopantothenate--cysteine ligase